MILSHIITMAEVSPQAIAWLTWLGVVIGGVGALGWREQRASGKPFHVPQAPDSVALPLLFVFWYAGNMKVRARVSGAS